MQEEKKSRTIKGRHTFASHSHFQALFESTVLALVAVMLVDGTVSVAPAVVGEVAANGSLEERLAPFAGKLTWDGKKDED